MDYTLRQQHILVLLNDLKTLADELGHDMSLAENGDAIDLLQHHVAQFRPTKTQEVVGKIKGFVDRCDGLLNGLPGILSVASAVYVGVKIIFTFAAAQGDAIQEIVKTFEDIYLSLPVICAYSRGRRNNMEDLLLPENRALLAALEAVLQFILDLVLYLGSEPGHGVMKRLLKPIKRTFKAPNFVEQVRSAREDMLHSFQLAHYAECAKQFKEAHRSHENKRLASAVSKLHRVAYESYLSTILDSIKAYSGACSWSQSHEDVLGWLENKDKKSHLLILGTPGTGKSTLAGYLIDLVSKFIRETKSDEVLLYYFCGFDVNSDPLTHTTETSSSRTILMTFLRQILATHPTYRDIEEEVIQGILSYNRNMIPEHMLKKWIVLLLASFARVSVIIDALDQCEASAFGPDGLISWLLHELPASRILILGREEPPILNALPQWLTIKLGSDGTTQHDLAKYARHIVLKVMRSDPFDEELKTHDLNSPLSDEETDLVHFLIKRADNMFFYLFLVLHSRQRGPYLSHDARAQSLRRTPKDIFGMYSLYIMVRIADNEASLYQAAIIILQFLIFSPEPVTWKLLLDAFVEHIPNQALQLSNVQHFARMAAGILFNVQKLVTGQEHLIPVHHTLQEYFHGTYTFDERIGPQGMDTPVVSRSKNLYETVSRQSHHFRFRTCCDSLRKPQFQTAIYIYQKCADVQRQSLDGASKRCVPSDTAFLAESANLIQRGHIHVKRLQSQLFQDQSFGLYDPERASWIDRQWAALDDDRRWREEKERSIDDLLVTSDVLVSREELQRQRHGLNIMQEEWDKGRKGLSESSTYPLCSYALHNIFYHFHWVQSQASDSNLAAEYSLLLKTILRYLNVALSGLAQDIVDRARGDPDSAHLVTMRQAPSVPVIIRSLEKLCTILAQLYDPDLSFPGGLLVAVQLLHPIFQEARQLALPAEVWNSAFSNVLGTSAVWKARKDLVFSYVLTVILSRLHDAERLCFEELKTCVGIGYLVFMIRHVRQMISHHLLLFYHSRSAEGPQKALQLPLFLDQERGFINTKILHEVVLDDAALLRISQRPTERSNLPSRNGLLVWNNKAAMAHPRAMMLVVSLSGMLGFVTSSHISILVVVMAVSRLIQPSALQVHYDIRSLLGGAPAFAVLGWLIGLSWNSSSQVRTLAFSILLAISLQACGHVHFSVHHSNDEMYFTGRIRSRRVSSFIIAVGSSSYCALLIPFIGLVYLLLGGTIMRTADMISIAYTAVWGALFLADPDGMDRILIDLHRIGSKYHQGLESMPEAPMLGGEEIDRSSYISSD